MSALEGLRVIELAGLGPAPFACMMLADLGADVIRIDRIDGKPAIVGVTPLDRGRRSAGIDIRSERGLEVLLRLAESADVLVEGFRPGVAERLGFGPEVLAARNPRLVFGRMTGWGQVGPLAHTSGHDINYIALAGVLGAVGRKGEAPIAPLNLVGDFGGGGMLLAYGILAALFERSRSGQGQVVDAAMVDGSALLMSMIYGLYSTGTWRDERGVNVLDTGAPFYDTYATKDGRHMAVGAMEPQFYELLLRGLGLDPSCMPRQYDRSRWAEMKSLFAALFRMRTREQWVEVFGSSDACVTPVLSLAEAMAHPHIIERGTFCEVEGVLQPSPAPRFSRTPTKPPQGPSPIASSTAEVLAGAGFSPGEIDQLKRDRIIG